MQYVPKITVEMVRALYPSPKRSNLDSDVGYCVLGALNAVSQGVAAESMVWMSRFPSGSVGARALCRLNPSLSETDAHARAVRVARYNDHQKFDLAWTVAEEALQYGDEK